jgi:hypothetical protein
VEQLTVQIAYDGYQELAGRKSQSGNQMRLKADYGGALNRGNVYLRNGGDYVTSKSATLVVGLTLAISDGCFLKKSDSLGISPLAIRVAPHVREEVIAATLFTPESFSVPSSASGLATMGS